MGYDGTDDMGAPPVSVLGVLIEGSHTLGDVRGLLLLVAELYRSGDESRSRDKFIEMIVALERFVGIATLVERALSGDDVGIGHDGRTITLLVTRLNNILRDIVAAQIRRDNVLLADLLEYELAPSLDSWRELFHSLATGLAAGK